MDSDLQRFIYYKPKEPIPSLQGGASCIIILLLEHFLVQTCMAELLHYHSLPFCNTEQHSVLFFVGELVSCSFSKQKGVNGGKGTELTDFHILHETMEYSYS